MLVCLSILQTFGIFILAEICCCKINSYAYLLLSVIWWHQLWRADESKYWCWNMHSNSTHMLKCFECDWVWVRVCVWHFHHHHWHMLLLLCSSTCLVINTSFSYEIPTEQALAKMSAFAKLYCGCVCVCTCIGKNNIVMFGYGQLVQYLLSTLNGNWSSWFQSYLLYKQNI